MQSLNQGIQCSFLSSIYLYLVDITKKKETSLVLLLIISAWATCDLSQVTIHHSDDRDESLVTNSLSSHHLLSTHYEQVLC